MKRSVELPPMDQVGYVVRDLDAALTIYEPLFGPFERLDSELRGALYRGEPADCKLRMAFGHSGDIEIEFIEIVEGRSPHSEFLEQGREGVHHIRFRVDDVEATLEALAADGYHPIWFHRLEQPDLTFAYAEHESRNGVILELLRMP